MSTFVLVPGAGGVGWYWHRLVPELERLGHQAIAVDIRETIPVWDCRIDEIPGGHLVALSNPVELAGRLDGFARGSL